MTRYHLRIEDELRVLRVGADAVQLTPTELRILKALISAPGHVFTRDELRARVFDGRTDLGVSRSLIAHVANLRRKLLHVAPDLVRTMHGRGYMIPARYVAPIEL